MRTIPQFINDADLFICEGVYGDDQLKQQADRFYQLIFSDTARPAKAGKVKGLWLTHYSQALADPENYLTPGEENFFEYGGRNRPPGKNLACSD